MLDLISLMAIDPKVPLTLRALEDHLWAAADLFRNKVSNQKDFILALLFFKRASDRHREETRLALAELEGIPADEAVAIIQANPRAYHSLTIPETHFWEDVYDENEVAPGQALNDALTAIGRANAKQLSSVFEHTDFNNKQALPAEDLTAILAHFNALGPLTNDRVAPDMLGDAYQWLIAKFAASSGKAGGEFYTPTPVGTLGARILAPQPGDEAYDPTCGSGGLLLEALEEARREHGTASGRVTVFGQELNPETWAIARMNVLLHGAGSQATIEQGDTLKTPKFLKNGKLRRFKLVIANPPFSSANWGHERLRNEGDPFGRIKHVPPKSHGEMAFVQHMVASLTDDGRMAVVLPDGTCFRRGPEQAVRKDLIDADLVEAIIQLPKDMFYGAGIPAVYLVINKAKPVGRDGKVLFINASDCFERRDTKNVLRDEDIQRIINAFRTDDPQEDFSAFATREQITQNDYNLTVRRYIGGASENGETLSFEEALAAYHAAQTARAEAEARLAKVLAAMKPETDT
ncbi:MAG: N-6 DNA methylase [Solirubrobacteraceae bacterium]